MVIRLFKDPDACLSEVPALCTKLKIISPTDFQPVDFLKRFQREEVEKSEARSQLITNPDYQHKLTQT